MINAQRLAAASLVAFALLLAGCDSMGGGTDTIEIDGNSPIPPEIEYVFEYAREDVSDGAVVVSAQPDMARENATLDAVLDANGGYSRSDIRGASVEGVVIDDASTTAGATVQVRPDPSTRVFRYLRQAEIRLGSSDGPVAARGEVSDDGPDNLALGSGAGDVLSVVKSESPTPAVLRLEVQSPSEVPTRDQGGDKVRVTVTYSLRLPAP